VERDERLGLRCAEAVEMRTRLSAEVEKMLEAVRRHERGPGSFALEQCVRRYRRPVCETLDTVGPDRARRGDDRLLLLQTRQNLRRLDATVVDKHGVGERAADIDAEDRHSGRLTP